MSEYQTPKRNQVAAAPDREQYLANLFEMTMLIPGVKVEELPNFDRPVDPYSIEINDPYTVFVRCYPAIARTESEDGYTRQSISAVIKAGGELFGVVEVGMKTDMPSKGSDAYKWNDVSAIVRLGSPDQAAQMVGVSYSYRDLIEVGRTAENGFSGTTIISIKEQAKTGLEQDPKTISLKALKHRMGHKTQQQQTCNLFKENKEIWQLDREAIDTAMKARFKRT